MKTERGLVRELTGVELAGRLEQAPATAHNPRARGVSLRRTGRLLFSASLAVGLAAQEPQALATPSGEGGYSCSCTTPGQAYNEGYAVGQALAAHGVDGLAADGYLGGMQEQDLNDAFNNGVIDGLEGLPANPPADTAPPGPGDLTGLPPEATPDIAYAIGYELGESLGYDVIGETGNPALDEAFDDGFGDGSIGAADACASACAAACGTSCAIAACGAAGCAGGGGCGGCG
jgi:hypothetical protein